MLCPVVCTARLASMYSLYSEYAPSMAEFASLINLA